MYRRRLPRIGLLTALALGAALPLGAQEVPEHYTTGPEVGEKIPDFEAIDQHGERRTFADLKGPRGALILFHRSADW